MKLRKVLNYSDDGENIYFSDENKLDSLYVDPIPEHTLIIKISSSFHPNFSKFYKIDSLVSLINQYKESNGDFKNLLIDFNESVVDPSGVDDLEKRIGKKCYYLNFDIDTSSDLRHIAYPHSMYTHLNYLIEDGFIEAKKFLENTILNYRNILKPHRLIFFSNNINLVRIQIFNLLKETNNLEDNIWSFNNSVQYYSRRKINLEKFLDDNKNLIPRSYDKFYDLNSPLSSLRVSLLPHYLSYFEILTESFYYTSIKNIENYTPCTEKIFKPIVGYQPFIVFASPRLRKTLEKIGLTFNSKLYGFYDISSESDVENGLNHIREQTSKSKEELHKEYFQNVEEYIRNCNIFLDFLIKNKSEPFKNLL